MTNFEKWKDTVLEILRKDDGVIPAVKKGIPVSCGATDCRQCESSVYHGNDMNCRVAFFEWLCKECKEKPILTKRQRAFCEVVSLKYLARDRNGGLYGYEKKPIKYNSVWSSAGNNHLIPPFFSPKFDFIRWEDDEPYPIEEMLTWEVEDGDE